MAFDTRHRSRTLVDAPDRAPARSYFQSVGYTADDLKKPLVMVAHEWIGTMPCNFNQRELAQQVSAGIRAAGGTPMEVNTISISDGISMGTEGMKASLISRDLIADSIELAGIGYSFDAAVVIVGCDKTIPAGAMALARLNIPGIVLYSGSIDPGRFEGRDVTIQDVFEGVGQHAAGTMTLERLHALEAVACPGAGACGAQYTANTMATVMEFMGLSPMRSATVGATDTRKNSVAYEAGELVMDVLKRGVLPSDILTREALGHRLRLGFCLGHARLIFQLAHHLAGLLVGVFARAGNFDLAGFALGFLNLAQLGFHLRACFGAGLAFGLADRTRLGILERFHRLLHARLRFGIARAVAYL